METFGLTVFVFIILITAIFLTLTIDFLFYLIYNDSLLLWLERKLFD